MLRRGTVLLAACALVASVLVLVLTRSVWTATSCRDGRAMPTSANDVDPGRIVFSTLEQRADSLEGDIFTVGGDGSGLKRLTSSRDPSSIPPGHRTERRSHIATPARD
jgi:hypothetical protein